MAKISAVVFADTESHADLARIANALMLVQEAKDAGDDVELVFDGAGTGWIPELTDPDHDLHEVFESIRDRVAGACEYCAKAFGHQGEIEDSKVSFLSEYKGHPSLRARSEQGFQIITF